jgi:hypothetical protein
MEIKRDDRTKFNLENYLRMAFHPKGFQGFAEGTINELNLENTQIAKILRASCFATDVAKYAPFAAITAKIVYDYFIK